MAIEAGDMNPVDEYIARIPSDVSRLALLDLRQTLREILPGAEEVLSYGIPAMKVGKPVVWFAAYKRHCSLFGGHVVQSFQEELSGFKVSKGGVQFPPDKPLPREIVVAITQARLAIVKGDVSNSS